MAKFRKKPIIIEAEQWFPGIRIEGLEIGGYFGDPDAYIETLEGVMKLSPGDWIITGIKGEKYPCKPDIFKATYELVEEENS